MTEQKPSLKYEFLEIGDVVEADSSWRITSLFDNEISVEQNIDDLRDVKTVDFDGEAADNESLLKEINQAGINLAGMRFVVIDVGDTHTCRFHNQPTLQALKSDMTIDSNGSQISFEQCRSKSHIGMYHSSHLVNFVNKIGTMEQRFVNFQPLEVTAE